MRVYEFTEAGYDGASDETDEKVKWIAANNEKTAIKKAEELGILPEGESWGFIFSLPGNATDKEIFIAGVDYICKMKGNEEMNLPDVVELHHYSKIDRPLLTIDPKFFGTAFAGAEKKRALNDPATWINRSYWYVSGGYKKEMELGNYRYVTMVESRKLYSLQRDPLGLKRLPSLRNEIYPGCSALNLNKLEMEIKKRGYLGFYAYYDGLGTVVGIFESLKGVRK